MRLVMNAFVAATYAGGARLTMMKGQKDDHYHNIISVSTASYQANSPIEDRVEISQASSPQDISSFTVLDGHGGWQVAEFAQLRIAQLLKDVFMKKSSMSNSADMNIEAIDRVKKVFLDLDAAYIDSVRTAFQAGFGEVARVGACCLSVVLHPDGRIICGNAGDCRAVLGRRSSKQLGSMTGIFSENDKVLPLEHEQIEAVNLSHDHNAKLEREKRRLREEHPDEPLSELVQCYGANACYVKGRLQPSRSLGDLYLKTKDFNGPPRSQSDPEMSRGAHIEAPYNPPYITSSPEVTVRQRSENDRFIVLASDGLWDVMSSEEVVSFVGNLYKKEALQHASKPDSSSSSMVWPWHSKILEREESSPAQVLVEEALRRVSHDYGMSMNELARIPPGRMRRQRHDDISVVVVFFK